MQIDRIPPRQTFRFPGTPQPVRGVPMGEPDRPRVELELVPRPGLGHAERDAEETRPSFADDRTRRGLAIRGWIMLALGCVLLLGQGERFQVDARFLTPGRTLDTYWRAIRHNDLQTVGECFSEPQSMPFPGMVWFLPPVDQLHIRSVHVVSAEGGKIVAAYEILFVPKGSQDAESFVTSSELVRVRHEWRIVPTEDASSMPPWKPYPRPVDS